MASIPDARPESGAAREDQVRTIFSEIAPKYDLLNHVLSLNIDRRWRRRAVNELQVPADDPDIRVLDACAGTYDLSLELTGRPGFRGRVVASDFARPMLVTGKDKLEGAQVSPVCGDSLKLPFPDGSFHRVMVAFGVRNLSDTRAGFAEFARVLRPGGRLVVLEFTTPPNRLMRGAYLFYFHRVLPLVGRVVSGHPWAYTYLPESVREFPGPEELADQMRDAGFQRTEWSWLTAGIAAIHVADVSKDASSPSSG
ncbi:MAG: class I SAM-dependent methyltransferase [Gemmatimonadales bacterium]|nr:MAG: class I SAM-dependent methyltransferase [Gemmatimonadales bacterium]